jgi:hypothetical protein
MLNDFLLNFKKAILSQPLQVYYDTQKKVAYENEVLIGIGQKAEGGLLLTNKIAGDAAVSVTQYIRDRQEVFFETWKAKFTDSFDLKGISLYIEDLSPDTCFSIILFFAKLNGVSFYDFSPYWFTYINQWEIGDVKSTGTMEKSWGALLNSLSHEYFVYTNEADESGYKYNQQKILDGFRVCLSFTIDLLLEKVNPSDVPVLQHSEGYHRAISFLNIEKLGYENTLRNATKIQLLLPLQNSSRRVFVDTIIATEMNVLATLKNHSRNDTVNSFFKMGFGLMAVHRPLEKGSGNDIAISVDPATGVHLKELWERLEELENSRWNGERPNNNKRHDFDVNQPWYSDLGKYTIIAAPRTLHHEDKFQVMDDLIEQPKLIDVIPPGEKVLGTKLTWDDVLNELWLLYNPVKELKVHPYLSSGKWGVECNVTSVKPIQNFRSKKFIGLKWAKTNPENTMIITPTFKQYLVACLSKNEEQAFIKDLPNEKSFDFIEVPGGFALVHNDGVVFFDDWSSEGSNTDSYLKEFDCLSQRNDAITTYQTKIKNEIQVIIANIKNKKKMRKEITSLSISLAEIKIELQNSIFDTMPKSNDYDVNQFRKVIEKRWGLSTQLNELYAMVNEIETTINNMVDSKTNKVVSIITIYGFPLSFYGGVFQDPLKNLLLKGVVDWSGLTAFAVLAIVSIFFIERWVEKA